MLGLDSQLAGCIARFGLFELGLEECASEESANIGGSSDCSEPRTGQGAVSMFYPAQFATKLKSRQQEGQRRIRLLISIRSANCRCYSLKSKGTFVVEKRKLPRSLAFAATKKP